MHTCPNCGKNVEGNMADPCPKCGFDPRGSAAPVPATGERTPEPPSQARERPLRIPRGVTTGGTVPAPAQHASLFHALRSWWRRRRGSPRS